MARGEHSLRRATARDHDLVVSVLARAFEHDPVTNYMLRHDGLERAFGAFFRHAVLPYDEAWIADEAGVALWTPPGKRSWYGLRVIAMAPALLAAVGATHALERARAAQYVTDKHPLAPHWYLFAIGVDPSMQGRGLGGALLHAVLDRCDVTKVPAYLEASTEKNARIYEHHGFRVTEEIRLGTRGPPLWLMWREPA